MKNFRIGVAIVAAVLFAVCAFYFDFENLSWEQNSGSYIAMIAATCVMVAMIGSNRSKTRSKG